MIRAVFFDAGGTLLRTAEPVGVTYARFAGHYGWGAEAEKTEQGFRRAWAERTSGSKRSDTVLGKEGWKKIVEASLQAAGMPDSFPLEDYFHEVYEHFARPDAWRAFPETEGVLLELQKRGLSTGLLSNWDGRLRKVLEGFSWSEHLHPLLISEEVGTEKPEPAIFRVAEERGGWRPEECVLIGDDAISDRGGAEQAGWRWALVDRPNRGLREALAALSL